MEILAVNEVHSLAYAMAALALWCLVMAFISYLEEVDFLPEFLTISAVVLGFIAVFSNPTYQYEAIIDDYNVVYEEGYEIISKNGDIYTLEEAD